MEKCFLFVLVYDITKRSSFLSIQCWIEEVRRYTTSDVILILVGNKCDLEDEREVFNIFDSFFFFEFKLFENKYILIVFRWSWVKQRPCVNTYQKLHLLWKLLQKIIRISKTYSIRWHQNWRWFFEGKIGPFWILIIIQFIHSLFSAKTL